MTTQHTPGPWEIVAHHTCGYGVCSEHGLAKRRPYSVRGQKTTDARGVEYTFDPAQIMGDGQYNRGVALANARLIAAAPDLLAACEEALDAALFATGDLGAGDYALAAEKVAEICMALRPAIAKATGEA